jgi:hypothetical protein
MNLREERVNGRDSKRRSDESARSDPSALVDDIDAAATDPGASAQEVDEGDRRRSLRDRLFASPSTGALVSGTVVLGAAATFGVLETTLAAGAAYAAYRVLRKKIACRGRQQDPGES